MGNQKISPAIQGSRSAPSAEAVADETLGKRKTPTTFASSQLLTLGKEKRFTTFIVSPTIYTLKRTPPAKRKVGKSELQNKTATDSYMVIPAVQALGAIPYHD